MPSDSPSVTADDGSGGERKKAFAVSFRNKPADFGLVLRHVRYSPAETVSNYLNRLGQVALFGVIGVALALLLRVLAPLLPASLRVPVEIALMASLVFAVLIFIRRLARDRVSSLFLGNGGALDRHLTADDDGLVITSEKGHSSWAWRGVERVVVTPSHILIFVERLAAHAVPRVAFSTPVEAEEFAAFAQHKVGRG